MRDYVKYRSHALQEEGMDHEALHAGVADTAVAASVLARFAELVRQAAGNDRAIA